MVKDLLVALAEMRVAIESLREEVLSLKVAQTDVDPLFTVQEVARMFHRSSRTVQRWMYADKVLGHYGRVIGASHIKAMQETMNQAPPKLRAVS